MFGAAVGNYRGNAASGETFTGNNNTYPSSANFYLNNTHYSSLSAWQSATGQDANSTQGSGTGAQACNTSVNTLGTQAIGPAAAGFSGALNTGLVVSCASSASPAACGSAAAGSVAIPTGVSSVTLQVNTSAVTANSQIVLFPDDTLGTKLGVTCNSTLATLVGGLAVTARTAGTSFTLTFNGTIATNPLCLSYLIVN